MKFDELKFKDISETHGKDGIQAFYLLSDSFCASVVRHAASKNPSYGSDKGLYEVALFDVKEKQVYVDAWKDDSLGHLDERGVEEQMEMLEGILEERDEL